MFAINDGSDIEEYLFSTDEFESKEVSESTRKDVEPVNAPVKKRKSFEINPSKFSENESGKIQEEDEQKENSTKQNRDEKKHGLEPMSDVKEVLFEDEFDLNDQTLASALDSLDQCSENITSSRSHLVKNINSPQSLGQNVDDYDSEKDSILLHGETDSLCPFANPKKFDLKQSPEPTFLSVFSTSETSNGPVTSLTCISGESNQFTPVATVVSTKKLSCDKSVKSCMDTSEAESTSSGKENSLNSANFKFRKNFNFIKSGNRNVVTLDKVDNISFRRSNTSSVTRGESEANSDSNISGLPSKSSQSNTAQVSEATVSTENSAHGQSCIFKHSHNSPILAAASHIGSDDQNLQHNILSVPSSIAKNIAVNNRSTSSAVTTPILKPSLPIKCVSTMANAPIVSQNRSTKCTVTTPSTLTNSSQSEQCGNTKTLDRTANTPKFNKSGLNRTANTPKFNQSGLDRTANTLNFNQTGLNRTANTPKLNQTGLDRTANTPKLNHTSLDRTATTPRMNQADSAKAKRRRKFPGPAGALPTLKAGMKFEDVAVQKPVLPTPKKIEAESADVPCTQNWGDRFLDDPWTNMKRDLEPKAEHMLQQFSIASLLRKASKRMLPRGKVPVACVMIDQLNTHTTDATVVLRDPSGEIKGTIHRQLLKDHPTELVSGTVLVLRQCGVFSPTPKSHYLNITPNNVVRIYTKSGAGETRCNGLSDFTTDDFVIPETPVTPKHPTPTPRPTHINNRTPFGVIGNRPVMNIARNQSPTFRQTYSPRLQGVRGNPSQSSPRFQEIRGNELRQQSPKFQGGRGFALGQQTPQINNYQTNVRQNSPNYDCRKFNVPPSCPNENMFTVASTSSFSHVESNAVLSNQCAVVSPHSSENSRTFRQQGQLLCQPGNSMSNLMHNQNPGGSTFSNEQTAVVSISNSTHIDGFSEEHDNLDELLAGLDEEMFTDAQF